MLTSGQTGIASLLFEGSLHPNKPWCVGKCAKYQGSFQSQGIICIFQPHLENERIELSGAVNVNYHSTIKSLLPQPSNLPPNVLF